MTDGAKLDHFVKIWWSYWNMWKYVPFLKYYCEAFNFGVSIVLVKWHGNHEFFLPKNVPLHLIWGDGWNCGCSKRSFKLCLNIITTFILFLKCWEVEAVWPGMVSTSLNISQQMLRDVETNVVTVWTGLNASCSDNIVYPDSLLHCRHNEKRLSYLWNFLFPPSPQVTACVSISSYFVANSHAWIRKDTGKWKDRRKEGKDEGRKEGIIL